MEEGSSDADDTDSGERMNSSDNDHDECNHSNDNVQHADDEESGDDRAGNESGEGNFYDDDREIEVISENESFNDDNVENQQYEAAGRQEINFENNDERYQYLLRELHQWALRGVSCTKVDELLLLLRPLYPNLPRSYKTLLETPRSVPTFPIDGGRMWYKGVAINIRQRVTEDYLLKHENVSIDVNIDGLEPFESTYHDSWPILGCLVGQEEPFVIGVYVGYGQIEDIHLYLENFVNEVENLQENGIELFGVSYNFGIRNYILDAPARSKVKCIVGHTARYACERCEVLGFKVDGVTTYLDFDARLRTDQSFREQTNRAHHSGESPLLRLGTRMVSQFKLEGMHLFHEGLFKRWCDYVLGDKSKKRRKGMTSAEVKRIMSDRILGFAPHMPREFKRVPRPLKYRPKFRAAEYRRLFLYDGLLVFKELPTNVYKNYRLLHAACYILSSPELYLVMNDIADTLLKNFVNHSIRLFGRHFVSLYVHCLIHFAKECAENGPLESFSAYKYETYLCTIKNLLRSPYQPLHQIAYRDSERNGKLCNPPADPNLIRLFKKHAPQQENVEGEQYYGITFSKTTLSVTERDCCFKTRNGEIAILRNIVFTPEREIILVGRIFQIQVDFDEFPMRTSLLGIVSVSHPSQRKLHWRLEEVTRKCVLLPCEGDSYLCIPMLHI